MIGTASDASVWSQLVDKAVRAAKLSEALARRARSRNGGENLTPGEEADNCRCWRDASPTFTTPSCSAPRPIGRDHRPRSIIVISFDSRVLLSLS